MNETPPPLPTAEALADDDALLACLRLVEILSLAEASSEERLDALMEARERLSERGDPGAPLPDLGALLRALVTDAQALLPTLDPLPLLLKEEDAHLAPSPYAQALMAWALENSPEAKHREAFEIRRQALADLEDRAEAQRRYVAFRRFLIQNPVAHRVEAFDLLGQIVERDDAHLFYEKIGPDRLDSDGGENISFFPCRRCRWPLKKVEHRLECESRDCRGAGAIYNLSEGGRLHCVGGMELPERRPFDPTIHRMATRLTWRRYCLPGVFELELEEHLEGEVGVENLTLWPNLDAVDLAFSIGETVIEVDVKSGRAVNLMIRDLNQHPPGRTVHVVVPDDRPGVADALRQARERGALHPNYSARTQAEFLRWLRTLKGGADHG